MLRILRIIIAIHHMPGITDQSRMPAHPVRLIRDRQPHVHPVRNSSSQLHDRLGSACRLGTTGRPHSHSGELRRNQLPSGQPISDNPGVVIQDFRLATLASIDSTSNRLFSSHLFRAVHPSRLQRSIRLRQLVMISIPASIIGMPYSRNGRAGLSCDGCKRPSLT